MNRILKIGLMCLSMLLAGSVCSCGYAQNKSKAKTTKTVKKSQDANYGKVRHITKAEFVKNVYDLDKGGAWKYLGSKPCILDFYAQWCGPCRAISPFLDNLAKKYKDDIVIYKIDVDKERDLARWAGASSIPLLVFIPMNGEPQANRGALPEAELDNAIQKVLLKK
ncbi:MAG: thioredoxin domain-containing protein [Paludibacteraceae bacterium]|jgi:thioredoxin|nr:thioredoxin domain-containing protein [Paludibacteraceae bacterium]